MNLSTEGKAEKKGTEEAKPRKRSLKRYLLEKMQVWINGLLEAERDEFWGRGRYAPLSGKEGNYRNGYRPRGINFFRVRTDRAASAAGSEGRIQIGLAAGSKRTRPGVGRLLRRDFFSGVFDAGPGSDHGEALGAEVRLEAGFADRGAGEPGLGNWAATAAGRTEVQISLHRWGKLCGAHQRPGQPAEFLRGPGRERRRAVL